MPLLVSWKTALVGIAYNYETIRSDQKQLDNQKLLETIGPIVLENYWAAAPFNVHTCRYLYPGRPLWLALRIKLRDYIFEAIRKN